MTSRLLTAGLTLALSVPLFAVAQTPEEKGLDIAREADSRAEGFGDFQADMKMVLITQRGDQAERELRVKTLEGKGEEEGDKSLTIFDTPRDVRGTAMLTFSYKTKDDDQWLYLPALRRVKTIASRNKSGPFMGSEFSFEDMRGQEVEKYTYKYLRDEACGELTCYVMERYPADEHSGYTKMVVWLDQAEYRTWKVDYYDRRGSLLKTLQASDFSQYQDKFWQPAKMSMVNHQTGKATDLFWSNYQYNTGMSEADFNQNSLKRAR